MVGSSQGTLRKLLKGIPDTRRKSQCSGALVHSATVHGADGALVHSATVPRVEKPAVQRTKCHIYFQQLHQSAAVPDPDQEDDQRAKIAKGSALSHGRRVKGQDPWESWTYHLDLAGPVTAAVQSQVVGLPVRTIGHTCPWPHTHIYMFLLVFLTGVGISWFPILFASILAS